MEIRQAILKAADSIENDPNLFDYSSLKVPDPGCGVPGCALGWIDFHLGMEKEACMGKGDIVYKALGIKHDAGFTHLTETVGHQKWMHSAKECAKALRQYADVHHPATVAAIKHTGIPDNVRKIFQIAEAA